ncbi:hypothetical protein E2C01_032109 [Portunus trituberculatus]|uniref:Uncharacterized protein n=1 Tax=Portunus trituberculatus TaxID=210409 RepID=A0A5B7F023_PORTR|nr:hypothetical protein [Portunus trituberculatus]
MTWYSRGENIVPSVASTRGKLREDDLDLEVQVVQMVSLWPRGEKKEHDVIGDASTGLVKRVKGRDEISWQVGKTIKCAGNHCPCFTLRIHELAVVCG